MSKYTEGIVFNIQNFSVHDGKGIRTIVFLKGCPLRCLWCSNPESQLSVPQLAFNPMKCLTIEKCTRCIDACPQQAISKTSDGYFSIDPQKCVHCHTCAQACPSGALNVYGKKMTVDAALNEVEKEAAFYARSGGGMTLSGGEALVQPEFAVELLKESKKRRIRTAMETCGYCQWEDLSEACKYLDELLYDIKTFDDATHKKGTGVSNTRIKENLLRVLENYPDLPVLVRTPVIPGMNDNSKAIQAVIDFLPVRKNLRYELLPYHRMGQSKYEFLGMDFPMKNAVLDDNCMKNLRVLETAANKAFANA